MQIKRWMAILSCALLAAACAAPPVPPEGTLSSPVALPTGTLKVALSRDVEDRILALDPENITAMDVRETLSRAPAPRVILLHGGVFPVYLAMSSFAKFMVGMGYPLERIRDPGDGSWSHSPYEPSERVAGSIAWYYEQDGLRPMLIGHSQGGMQVSKVLHDLAGTFGTQVQVWNPLTDQREERTTISDPFTGLPQPVIGTKVSYASAVGAGGPSGVLPNQWGVIGRLRDIPNTVVQFNGYFIGIDWFAMTFAAVGGERYRSDSASVQIRNVVLPAGYLHVSVPVTGHLPDDPELRRLIDEYRPTTEKPDEATMPGTYSDNFYYAADNWHAVKKHWALETQRLVKARRAAAPPK